MEVILLKTLLNDSQKLFLKLMPSEADSLTLSGSRGGDSQAYIASFKAAIMTLKLCDL